MPLGVRYCHDMILSSYGRIMAAPAGSHPIVQRRESLGWSQSELARRSGLPRTSVGAIEAGRLSPAVSAALALARALGCSVEELFGGGASPPADIHGPEWAWEPRGGAHRYWEAEVAGRRLLFPVEGGVASFTPHDGVWQSGVVRGSGSDLAEKTLVLACCDPAAGLLATEYAQASGFRLLVVPRGSGEALTLLGRGLIHVAGVHRSTDAQPELNALVVRERLGVGYSLVRAARWESGLALAPDDATRAVGSVVRGGGRWALREPGSVARECLDHLSGGRRLHGRIVHGHAAVAEAVRAGWARAGLCVRLAADEAGLNFLPVRTEALDFCFTASQANDPRVQALVRLLRSRAHRRLVSELPGYDARETGETSRV